MGSPARSRILDDLGEAGPTNWQWGSAQKPVDVVVVCYADSPEVLKTEIGRRKEKMAKAAGMNLVSSTAADDKAGRQARSRAFRLRRRRFAADCQGTARAKCGRRPMHLVAAGEFLFGYRDEHGFYPALACRPRFA